MLFRSPLGRLCRMVEAMPAFPRLRGIGADAQIESWANNNIVAWSAVSYEPTGAKQPALGTIKIEGPTRTSVDERVVSMDLRVTEYNFKSLTPDQVKALVAEVQARPMNERVIDLDRVLAAVDKSELKLRDTEGMKADPPKVFWAPAPAILVNLDGEAIWSPIEGLDLRYALNTNWDLFEQTATNTLYLRYNESWLQASAVTGPCSCASRSTIADRRRRGCECFRHCGSGTRGRGVTAVRGRHCAVPATMRSKHHTRSSAPTSCSAMASPNCSSPRTRRTISGFSNSRTEHRM